MKQYEELTRLQVNQAIQRGLEAQKIHRVLSESEKAQSNLNNQILAMKPARWISLALALILKIIAG